jgi:hypothetical protein
MSSNVLSSRDTNAQIVKSSPEKKEEKPKTLDYQRQMLNKRLNGDKWVCSVVEKPAELILEQIAKIRFPYGRDHVTGDAKAQHFSQQAGHEEVRVPAIKISGIKADKHRAKPQTLFKTTSSKNYESAKGTAMFADVSTETVKDDIKEQA